MASGAGTTDAALGRRGRSATSTEIIGAPKRGSSSEHTVARMHSSGRRLIPAAAVAVIVPAVAGYLAGRLPPAWGPTAALAGGAVLIVAFAVVPFIAWLSRVYVLTTRRVIVRSGLVLRSRQEVLLTRGFDVTLRRGPLQLLARSGDIEIETGSGEPILLRDVPSAVLVHATLTDLLEYSTRASGTSRQQRIDATRRPFDP